MTPAKFVVTGCSRSGTLYTAKLLSAAGYPCGHERIFNPYGPPYGPANLSELRDPFTSTPGLRGEASFLATPFLRNLPPGTVVLHQVRDPLAVIRSHMGIHFFREPYRRSPDLADLHPRFLRVIGRHCPEVFDSPDELTRCMRYWTAWNSLTEQASGYHHLSYLRYRVEDMDGALLRRIVLLLGSRVKEPALATALASVCRSTNSRTQANDISWETLPEGADKQAIEQHAIHYGYAIS